ncbi:MAG: type I-U CRISPR-associated helicase/endonuclease Cas3 [Acidobacteria bacterium]|nr:type I-U CRISPR-associated helicase/endonuclease Cas3 [Acidobacteriota bacterium]
MTLTTENFGQFFEELHGYDPFPWQSRLLREVFDTGRWPRVLDLPTGSGKTAAMDVALFHLALEAERGRERRAPVRIAFIVDRRLVVDDAYSRALAIEKALQSPKGEVCLEVAARLGRLAESSERPLIARRLRGGIPREHDWARTPSQPTILCSTVDQVGSRLLFRGYGVTNSMKPVHAGLLGADCLLLLDEAHLAEPFRQTLHWIDVYRSEKWREARESSPHAFALLTATPGDRKDDHTALPFSLKDDDRNHQVLQKRLDASKKVRLIETKGPVESDLTIRTEALVGAVEQATEHFKNSDNGAARPAIAVIVNRVARARSVYEELTKRHQSEIDDEKIDLILMIGPARSIDRDQLADRLKPIRTRTLTDAETRKLEKTMVVVATQCLEAGVDVDLDAVISEAAPIDSLRQRFGRLNRAGRDITPWGAVIAMSSDLHKKYEDPVYGGAIKEAWDRMAAAQGSKKKSWVDFGLSTFAVRMDPPALAPKDDAPVLMPAHLDLLSHTSPIPAADPDSALYLHGPHRAPDSVTVAWRADLEPRNTEGRRLLTLVPPQSGETIELPVWAVRRWLERPSDRIEDLADVPSEAGEDSENRRPSRRQIFRWKGDDDASEWIEPGEIRPGENVVVPASYGGLDEYGWKPGSDADVADVGAQAAAPFAGRRFSVRVHPSLPGVNVSETALSDALASVQNARWKDARDVLLGLPLEEQLASDLGRLSEARRGAVHHYFDLYGKGEEDRPRGVVFVAPLGLKDGPSRDAAASATEARGLATQSTEDDLAGSIGGYCLPLEQHSKDVEEKAGAFASRVGLSSDRVRDLSLAGYLHDHGKSDQRFQRWLYYGDPLGADPETVIAKSARPLPRKARAASGLPEHWRHEALSVRKAMAHERLTSAADADLVLWLVGTHHGFGRPFYPHSDPTEKTPEVGPQSLAFDWKGRDWPTLFETLKARYGVWELARMEAILRLADHRASEDKAMEVHG